VLVPLQVESLNRREQENLLTTYLRVCIFTAKKYELRAEMEKWDVRDYNHC